MRPRSAATGVFLAGVLELGALAALGWVPGLRATPFPAIGVWLVAFGAYAAAGWLQLREELPVSVVWGVGIGLRLVLLPLVPHFSEDLYRFLWDGWVQQHGWNPFVLAPADPALASLRLPWHFLINHPEVPTIYPPGAQLVFRALALAGPSLLLFKGAWIFCDLCIAWLIQRLSSQPAEGRTAARGPSLPLLLYLWHPLVVLEVAWSGHLEPLAVLPMMGALAVLAGRTRPTAAGLLLGLGSGVKFAPAAAFPALLRRYGVRPVAAGILCLALLYLPYLDAGHRLWTGLFTYAERWRFNPGLYRILEIVPGTPGPRIAAAFLVAAIAAAAFRRAWSVERSLFWILGAILLFTPTLHPWYLLWVLPFAALRRSPAWLLLGGLAFLSYAGRDTYLATGHWPLPGWLAGLIYGPTLLWIARDGVRKLRNREAIPAS